MIQENISLKKFNTFGIDVFARYFMEVNTIADIQNLMDDKINGSRTRLVLGGGSNILFTRDFNGIVVKNKISGIQLIQEDAESYFLKVGAGELWHTFVMYCVENNYGGVENLSLIPGSVGAAPIQNIGAYGVEQKEVFYELEAVSLEENKVVTITKDECKFGYRDSIFKKEAKDKFIITSVTFKLFKKWMPNSSYGAINMELEKMGIKDVSLQAISQAVCNIRRSKLPDPEKIGNAGSFFKNPVVSNEKFVSLQGDFPSIIAFKDVNGMKLAAGWLIEQCEWKGKSFGEYGVHKDQALVLVNYGGANGSEIYELSGEILESVHRKFGVRLEREVVIA